MNKALQRLYEYLKQEESIPLRDNAKIITAAGIDAAATVKAIKRCILIVENAQNDDK